MSPRHCPAATRRAAVRAVRAGESLSATARRLGVSVHAVWKWCRAEGIQSSHPQGRAPVPLAEQERAVALVQQGATYNLAARQLRLSVASVRRWCLAAGVQSERQAAVRDPQRKARMQRQRAQGATLAEIGRRYGVSGERVRQILAAEARRQQKGQVK